MAAQMARLLCESDLAELEEVVRRWIEAAPSERVRQTYRSFGSQLLELKHALAELPARPSREELEFQLNLMLQLAAGHPR
jgi:hypothetical protein